MDPTTFVIAFAAGAFCATLLLTILRVTEVVEETHIMLTIPFPQVSADELSEGDEIVEALEAEAARWN